MGKEHDKLEAIDSVGNQSKRKDSLDSNQLGESWFPMTHDCRYGGSTCGTHRPLMGSGTRIPDSELTV